MVKSLLNTSSSCVPQLLSLTIRPFSFISIDSVVFVPPARKVVASIISSAKAI